ncbi:MAG: hypothetical protein ABI927_01840 [Gaiellaceae bacterium]
MRKLAVLSAAVLALAVAAVAMAAATVTYDDVVSVGKPVSITVRTYRPTAFKVLLRVQTIGRTQLFLTGKHAPKGGALIDTKTYACEGAAGSYYCKASYEELPAGTYTWRIVRVSGPKENTTLTVRW